LVAQAIELGAAVAAKLLYVTLLTVWFPEEQEVPLL
jgi:hypothetical protein